VTFDVGKAVTAIKGGRVEFRVEKAGIVHCGIGKVSFGAKKLEENIASFLDSVVKAKPKTSKGIYVQSISVSSTMGPGIGINPSPYRG
jgi:large subunit ribosomal protein L1